MTGWQPSLLPTNHAEEIRQAALEGQEKILSLDLRASHHERKESYSDAAATWLRAARAAEELIALQPGAALELSRLAAVRVKNAQRCLARWLAQLVSAPATSGLRLVDQELEPRE